MLLCSHAQGVAFHLHLVTSLEASHMLAFCHELFWDNSAPVKVQIFLWVLPGKPLFGRIMALLRSAQQAQSA